MTFGPGPASLAGLMSMSWPVALSSIGPSIYGSRIRSGLSFLRFSFFLGCLRRVVVGQAFQPDIPDVRLESLTCSKVFRHPLSPLSASLRSASGCLDLSRSINYPKGRDADDVENRSLLPLRVFAYNRCMKLHPADVGSNRPTSGAVSHPVYPFLSVLVLIAAGLLCPGAGAEEVLNIGSPAPPLAVSHLDQGREV